MRLLWLVFALVATRNVLTRAKPSLNELDEHDIDSVDENAEDNRETYIDEHGAMVVPMGRREANDMYRKWVEQATSALLASLADEKIRTEPQYVRKEFGSCTKFANNMHDHARCLTKLWDGDIHRSAETRRQKRARQSRRLEKLKPTGSRTSTTFHRRRRRFIVGVEDEATRASTVQRADTYALRNARVRTSPAGTVARTLLNTVRELNHRDDAPAESWQQTLARAKKLAVRRKELRQKMKEAAEDDHEYAMMRALQQQGGHSEEMEDLHDEMDGMYEKGDGHRKVIRRVQESRRFRKDPMNKVANLVRDGVKIMYTAMGKNASELDSKTMRVGSPRFFSVVPEDRQSVDLLSPSVLSLHNEGSGVEKLTSVPNMMQEMGLDDRDAWLDLVMEAAGVREQLDNLEVGLSDPVEALNRTKRQHALHMESMKTPDGQPLYFNKENATRIYGKEKAQRIEMFEDLQRMLDKEQLARMSKHGVAVLSREQLDLVYGPNSAYHDPVAHSKFSAMSEADVFRHLATDVRGLAQARDFDIRYKDLILSPVAFTWLVLNPAATSQTIVLSPVLFSPIVLSPFLFGTLVLSPWIFTPHILSPKVICPLILSPFLLSPLVLTPLVIHPIVLSPGVLTPIILSPLVMTPIILCPLVFVPTVLTPFVLSPGILMPGVGNPRVLSPFVLSPLVYAPQALGALLFSPYALSPVLASPLAAFSVLFSPSWLS